jgi:glycosyltransferase involved in cell wall biosynthesis
LKIRTFLFSYKSFKLEFFYPKKNYFEADLNILEFGFRNVFQLLCLKLFSNGRIAFWGHGEENSRNFSKIEKRVRKIILNFADFFFVYTKSGYEYLVKNTSLKPNQIIIVNNSTDTEYLSQIVNQLKSNSRIRISTSNFQIACISSLEKSKKVEKVFEIHQSLSDKIPMIKTWICGDGPERTKLESSAPRRIYFTGRLSPQNLAKVSQGLVAIVAPGPVGLVVTDSFALGVPLIVSSNQNHGPEFSYLQNGYNCIIVEDRIDEYVRAVLRLGNDPMLQKVLSRGMKESLDLYGTNQMTNNFIDGITKCLYSDYK